MDSLKSTIRMVQDAINETAPYSMQYCTLLGSLAIAQALQELEQAIEKPLYYTPEALAELVDPPPVDKSAEVYSDDYWIRPENRKRPEAPADLEHGVLPIPVSEPEPASSDSSDALSLIYGTAEPPSHSTMVPLPETTGPSVPWAEKQRAEPSKVIDRLNIALAEKLQGEGT